MKKLRELPYELADKLELPEDVLLGSAKLTVTGGRSAVIENHRGVLEYTAERIVVAVPRGKVCLDGTAHHGGGARGGLSCLHALCLGYRGARQ